MPDQTKKVYTVGYSDAGVESQIYQKILDFIPPSKPAGQVGHKCKVNNEGLSSRQPKDDNNLIIVESEMPYRGKNSCMSPSTKTVFVYINKSLLVIGIFRAGILRRIHIGMQSVAV